MGTPTDGLMSGAAADASSSPNPVTPLGRVSDRSRRWHIHHVLRDKPHLQFVPTDDVADDQIIGTVVTRLRRAASHGMCFLQDNLMRVQQARNLYRWLFTTLRRPWNQRGLRNIVRHRDTHATQQLNALG